jgi:hypothetical protein
LHVQVMVQVHVQVHVQVQVQVQVQSFIDVELTVQWWWYRGKDAEVVQR